MKAKLSQVDNLQETIDNITAEIEDLDIQREEKVEELEEAKRKLFLVKRTTTRHSRPSQTKFEIGDKVELLVEPFGLGTINSITKTGKSAYVELEGQDRIVLKRITSIRIPLTK